MRGFHSTGVSSVEWNTKEKGYDYWFHKDAVTGAQAVNDGDFKNVYRSVTNRAIMGHNRWATAGAVNQANAHPFSHPGFVLAHNGTLDTTYELEGDFDTDSEHICYTFSQGKCIKETLEKLNGAFALVWFDINNDTINFARNDERPLYLVRSDSKDKAYFASEKGMLEWCASRNKITLEAEPTQLPVGEWWSFDINEMKRGKELRPKVTKFTPKERTRSWNNWNSGYRGSNYRYNKPAGFPLGGEKIECLVTDVEDNQYYEGFINVSTSYPALSGEWYQADAFRVDKSLLPGVVKGDVIRGKVATIANTCKPVKIYLKADSLEILENFTTEEEEPEKKQCSNCLQTVTDYVEYGKGVVICEECTGIEEDIGLWQ